MLIFPKQHFSWNQLQAWETDKELYRQKYFTKEGVANLTNRGMAKGKEMAEALEAKKLSGDPLMDAVMVMLPKFEIMDIEFLVDFRIDGDIIPLWIQPDSYKADLTEYLEYKTSQIPWTKKMADEHRQIDFYDVGIWIRKNGQFIPKHKIIDVRTRKDPRGKIMATGEFFEIETKRSTADILRMMVRIKKAVKEISEEYNKFLFS
ncbi:MAG: hypothetical protein PHN89_00460 [Candidatus Pacebacteria bacterium]|nr:hypothetical protein [Candidatus Paceibacterota bacterium]